MIYNGRQYVMEYDGKELIVRQFGENFEYLKSNAIVDARKFIKSKGIKFYKNKLVVKGYIDFEFDSDKIKTQQDLGGLIAKHTMVSF